MADVFHLLHCSADQPELREDPVTRRCDLPSKVQWSECTHTHTHTRTHTHTHTHTHTLFNTLIPCSHQSCDAWRRVCRVVVTWYFSTLQWNMLYFLLHYSYLKPLVTFPLIRLNIIINSSYKILPQTHVDLLISEYKSNVSASDPAEGSWAFDRVGPLLSGSGLNQLHVCLKVQ